jgi:microcystin-dependent protein
MSDPYIGEIRTFGFSFPPYEWAFCNGAQMNPTQNQALFAVIGTTFGGDGKTTFMLPNLMGMAVMGAGSGPGLTTRTLGSSVGATTVTLTQSQLPAHSHSVSVAPSGPTVETQAPAAGSFAGRLVQMTTDLAEAGYESSTSPPPQPNTTLLPTAVTATGTGTAHANQQPYQTLSFCISLSGEYPMRPS